MALDDLGLWVSVNNIAQFQRQIKAETDESMRKVLVGLLEREEVKHTAEVAKHKAAVASHLTS